MVKSVYIITSSEGTTKVGLTRNLQSRLRELQLNRLPDILTVVRLFAIGEKARLVEKRAHGILSEFRISEEWFSCDEEVAANAIRKVCSEVGVAPDEEVRSDRYALTGRRGPAPTGRNPISTFRVPTDITDALDKIIASSDAFKNRPDLIRVILRQYLISNQLLSGGAD